MIDPAIGIMSDSGAFHQGKKMADNDDTKIRTDTCETFGKIRQLSRASISTILLDLQAHYKISSNTSMEWARRLECLCLESHHLHISRRKPNMHTILQKRRVDLFSGSYIALSYTWDASEDEDATLGAYSVKVRPSARPIVSRVRNVILNRAIAYMKCVQCTNLWIDRECIRQDQSPEQELAIQSMDLVYSWSRFPIALLSVRINNSRELYLLTRLLRGEFAAYSSIQDTPCSNEVEELLILLNRIVSNRWWSRTWTFQEDYRASISMKLLLRHAPMLERQKRSARKCSGENLFGILKGEICVSSADFRTECSELCTAYQKQTSNPEARQICRRIIERVPKYTVLLRKTNEHGERIIQNPMSPMIFAHIGAREIKKESDRLAIAANCCVYPVRLQTENLRKTNCSLSLAMLALYLLNGEIIVNDNRGYKPLELNLYEILKQESLKDFKPPFGNELTFAKGCRFVDVELSHSGVETVGHVWKLGDTIRTNKLSGCKLPYDYEDGFLSRVQRRMLKKLIQILRSRRLASRCKRLIGKLETYLRQDLKDEPRSFSKVYKDTMTEEIVDAMRKGKTLHLASLVNRFQQEQSGCRYNFTDELEDCADYKRYKREDDYDDYDNDYLGIFIANHQEQNCDAYIFTSSCSTTKSFREIDKHVSLKVHWQNTTKEGLPKLLIKNWLNGLCFFDGYRRRKVVFPWPDYFTV